MRQSNHHLSGSTLQMLIQQWMCVRVQHCPLINLLHQEFRAARIESVNGIIGEHQNCSGSFATAPGTTGLLPKGREAAWEAEMDGDVEVANVNAEFEGVGGDDAGDTSSEQARFDFPATVRKAPALVKL